jgi:hypothetical protein
MKIILTIVFALAIGDIQILSVSAWQCFHTWSRCFASSNISYATSVYRN